MINRSQLKEIEANPTVLHIPENSKFFYSRKDAVDYQMNLGNVVSKIDQWLLNLDDMSESEAKEKKAFVEQLIREREQDQKSQYGKVLMTNAQRNLLRSVYYSSTDIYSVSVVSEKTAAEFYRNELNVLVYDDEINGATKI